MITKEENELLTRTDPRTPAGALLRRYWQPVALSDELPPGGEPHSVKILGEELVLFRDNQGRPGLLGLHCSHRGTDLSYGRIEDGGLRCVYHGWLYDIHGRCLEQPGEPGGGAHRDAIRHPAYPCEEKGGVIFTYMAPGKPSLLPNYEFLGASPDHLLICKIFQECNYLQANEGNIDPVHLSYLHRFLEGREERYRGVRGGEESHYNLVGKDLAPTIEVELTDFGVRIYTTRKQPGDKVYLRVSYFILPNLSAFPGQTGGEGYSVNWHGFQAHDVFATTSQGTIQDRTEEHLVSSDKAILAARKLIEKAIRDVQEGREPPHVVRDPSLNRFPHLQVISDLLPATTDLKQHTRSLEAEARARL